MVNLSKLQDKINESGMTIVSIAKKAGLSRETVYNRLKGKGEFTASEILMLTDILHLSKSERDDIFLREKLN